MTKEKIILQLATAADAPVIARMSRDLIENGFGWSWTEERVIRSITRANSEVLKASIDGKFAGFGIMSFEKLKANLNLLATQPALSGKGIASTILHALEHKAHTKGLEDLYVQVRESNIPALRFYAKFGYELVDRNPNYYLKYRQTSTAKIEAAMILYKYCPLKKFGRKL